ncbi:hypothetical protein AAGG74_14950 [Bacillus mexicanus]|uniref:hypothetical protein n=1 Tax=Bacillus mexicanus TaxID=2834415 RepID=UPI003D22C152
MNCFLTGMKKCLEEGMELLRDDSKGITSFDDLEIQVWKQTWPDTTLGFGGIGGQEISSVYTVVVMNAIFTECVVFHGMRLAYKTDLTKEISERISKNNLLGKFDFHRKTK